MKEKDKKIVKIGKLEMELNAIIAFIVLIVLFIIYILSPNIYSITTARYGEGSEADNNNVKIALGETNTKDRFLIYFQWYNVIHELGHGILIYNSDIKIGKPEEEQLVNDFAVAYWRQYGEKDKINELEDIVEYACNNIVSDANDEMTYMEYAKENWGKSSFNTFNNYGWFQFNCVKESLNKEKTLDEVLNEMGIKDAKLNNYKMLEYPIINEKTSTQIINDAVNNFHEWGIEFPKIYHKFSNNPNNNSSGNRKNFLGIYNLLENF